MKARADRVLIEVVIVTGYSEEEQCYYAWSPQLGCIRDGDNEERAVALCQEALEIRFESLIERGTLKETLESHGYTLVKHRGQQQFDRPSGALYDRRQAQAITHSKSFLIMQVQEVKIQPEARAARVS